MGYFNFQPFYFLSEFDSLRVSKWFSLLVYVSNIQNFAHEFYNRLRFVESSSGNCKQSKCKWLDKINTTVNSSETELMQLFTIHC